LNSKGIDNLHFQPHYTSSLSIPPRYFGTANRTSEYDQSMYELNDRRSIDDLGTGALSIAITIFRFTVDLTAAKRQAPQQM